MGARATNGELRGQRAPGGKGEGQVARRGGRARGRSVLFKPRGEKGMMPRRAPPQDPGREPMPERVVPMAAQLSKGLPPDQEKYGFEFKWDGIRAVVYSQGGTIRIQTRSLEDVTRRYPEVRPLTEALGSHEVVLDG